MLDPLIFFIAVYGAVMLWQALRLSSNRLYKLTDMKPLNCPVCMSFWIGLIMSLMIYSGAYVIMATFGAVGFTYIMKIVEEGITGG